MKRANTIHFSLTYKGVPNSPNPIYDTKRICFDKNQKYSRMTYPIEWGLMDYKRNDIIVEQHGEKFIVSLKFKFVLTNEEIDVENKDSLVKKWCAKHTPEQVVEDFGYIYNVSFAAWIEKDVIEFVIDRERDQTPESILADFKTNSLADGSWEGMPGETFWVVPASFATE